MREEDEVAEELTERIGFTMKETKKEDEYHAKVTKPPDCRILTFSTKLTNLTWCLFRLGWRWLILTLNQNGKRCKFKKP